MAITQMNLQRPDFSGGDLALPSPNAFRRITHKLESNSFKETFKAGVLMAYIQSVAEGAKLIQ